MTDIKEDFPAYPQNGIYLDSATINLQPISVIEAQNWYNRHLGSVLRKSLYKRSRKSTEIYLDVKELLVSYFGGISENYVFVPNMDYAWNLIFRSIVDHHILQSLPKPVFTTSIFEEHSILAPLIQLHTQNNIELILIEKKDPEQFLLELSKKVPPKSYMVFSHISLLFGFYLDLKEISKLKETKDAILLIDLSRSSGQNPIRIAQYHLDLAVIDPSFDLLGPQGICAVYFSEYFYDFASHFSGTNSVREVRINIVDQLNSFERFEIGNINLPSLNGFKASLSYVKQKGSKYFIEKRISVQNKLRSMLNDIEEILPISNLEMNNNPGSIITFRVRGTTSHDFSLLLEEAFSIEIRSGTLCSHPGLKLLSLNEVLTVSTHVYNTDIEIETFVDSLSQARSMLL